MSNVPTRNKPRNFQSTQDIADTHQHIDGTLNHDDCSNYLPAPSSIFTPIPAVGRTTASVTTSRLTPNTSSAPVSRETTRSPPVFSRSPPLEQLSPHTRNDVAIQSPITPTYKLTYNLLYLRMPLSTKDNHQTTTSQKSWTLQLETLGERLLQTRLSCNYDLARPHKKSTTAFYDISP